MGTLVLFSSGILQFAERVEYASIQNSIYFLPFQYYIYFVMTTISTMGYENIFSNSSARVLIIVLIIFAFVFVQGQLSILITHLSSKSFYMRRSYKVSEHIPHIVITGNQFELTPGTVSSIAAEDFFKELFHKDHGEQTKHAVILMPNRPDPSLEDLINKPQNS